MSMVIGTNVASITAQRHLASSRVAMETAMERLSSGLKINSSMDDAAGLAIATRMEGQIKGFGQAVKNANDGISMLQTAEGGMEQTTNILMRMRELAVQSASGTYSDADRTSINEEFEALTSEVTRIASQTQFNGVDVLNSTASVKLHVGADADDLITLAFKKMGSGDIGDAASSITEVAGAGAHTAAAVTQTHTLVAAVTALESLDFNIGGTTYSQAYQTSNINTMNMLADQVVAGESGVTSKGAITATAFIIGFDAGTLPGQLTRVVKGGLEDNNVSNATNAAAAITSIDAAMVDVSSYRGSLGAISNRLEHTVENLLNRSENTAAAQSRIRDTDFATESANLARSQILQQAGTAMLVQANQSGKGVLSLLK